MSSKVRSDDKTQRWTVENSADVPAVRGKDGGLQFHCAPCNVRISGTRAVDEHVRGAKHIKRIAELEALEKKDVTHAAAASASGAIPKSNMPALPPGGAPEGQGVLSSQQQQQQRQWQEQQQYHHLYPPRQEQLLPPPPPPMPMPQLPMLPSSGSFSDRVAWTGSAVGGLHGQQFYAVSSHRVPSMGSDARLPPYPPTAAAPAAAGMLAAAPFAKQGAVIQPRDTPQQVTGSAKKGGQPTTRVDVRKLYRLLDMIEDGRFGTSPFVRVRVEASSAAPKARVDIAVFEEEGAEEKFQNAYERRKSQSASGTSRSSSRSSSSRRRSSSSRSSRSSTQWPKSAHASSQSSRKRSRSRSTRKRSRSRSSSSGRSRSVSPPRRRR